MKSPRLTLVCVGCLWGLAAVPASAATRLERIRQRGSVVCGVSPGVAGFAQVDARGRYSGFDVDICRAIAAAEDCALALANGTAAIAVSRRNCRRSCFTR